MKGCAKCLVTEAVEHASLNEQGICSYCRQEPPSAGGTSEVLSESELKELLRAYVAGANRPYDLLVPLSGGVDSSFTLIKLVRDFGLRVLAFHNDHGYESELATRNARELCRALGADLIIVQQDLGQMKKLWRYTALSPQLKVSGCYVCGNILYLNAILLAKSYGIPLVINGYSKGQALMMGDKLNSLGWLGRQFKAFQEFADPEFLAWFLKKYRAVKWQIQYRGKQDLLAGPMTGKALVIPFFVFPFFRTEKAQLREEVRKVFPWTPMPESYPSGTTNCEMVWVNTYFDLQRLGYSVYELEYSELIRRGEMSKAAAQAALVFNPDPVKLSRLLADIGLPPQVSA